ncbi:hypothetical protein M5I08_07320 [Candidatus Mycobacterium methanotrophicum]|uniref:Uncharacterized protein n=2 Tax=Candidatus Mycobacterium methanotrophicum TaxID=2943498 RepID=A0ABY4QT01_9MYCO|nr:hypothetical protein [Candidatus Mycobacterium methanotrophicum]UQX12969.1 hypothetical protein M5I08_07320 [Candidatus Mycobacterium methanotrophicum]
MPGADSGAASAPHTRIIRRAPTAAMPQIADDAHTTHIPRQPPPSRYGVPSQRPGTAGKLFDQSSSATAVAASAVSIVSGWATSVVATDLIAGWWKTDRLFCVAVAFLTLVFAFATIIGVIQLLLRRSLGRYLIVAGAVVALLTYGGVFIAGARVAWIVHALPLLPISSAVLALIPRTKDWMLDD